MADRCEAVALREGVGVVVLVNVAGFLPWAVEDTINARSVLCFWLTRVVPESNRADGGLLGCSKASVEDGKKWKGLAEVVDSMSVVRHNRRDCHWSREHKSPLSQTSGVR